MKIKSNWLKSNTDLNIIGIFLYGSQNYGLDKFSKEKISDVDTIVVIMPSLMDLINNRLYNHEFHLKNGEHIVVKDIRLYKDQLIKASPVFLETLSTKYKIITDNDFNGILKMGKNIENMNKEKLMKCLFGQIRKNKSLILRDLDAGSDYNLKDFCNLIRLYFEYKFLIIENNLFLECFHKIANIQDELLKNALNKKRIDNNKVRTICEKVYDFCNYHTNIFVQEGRFVKDDETELVINEYVNLMIIKNIKNELIE